VVWFGISLLKLVCCKKNP